MNTDLIKKYNIPGPRYTSYPTVPFWNSEGIILKDWINSFKKSFSESNSEEGISLYIHLPFCESLCTFCGCHKHITKRHEVEIPYINSVLKEWELYLHYFDSKPNIKEIHLGGGTPTFFSPDQLKKLIDGILSKSNMAKNYEFSFEGHPNNTSKEHLQILYQMGFRRCSFGVQDYDQSVQKAINRIQSFEQVKSITEQAREIGYTSVSHDLVFGLPKQNRNSIIDTIEKTCSLIPDRIAFYSYAHVPWIKGVGQRGFDENDLPKDEEKRELYEIGKKMFDDNDYVEIGMDHFSLKSDSLYKSMINKSLHRNFMGYTNHKTQLMIGLGMSSISDSWYAFSQNFKTVLEYQQSVENGVLPIFKGHVLNPEDLAIRQHILNIMCHFETDWSEDINTFPFFEDLNQRLSEFELDGLLTLENNSLKIKAEGIPFVRNVCMQFDSRLLNSEKKENLFSKTI